ncbi:MAG: L-threonylcarbamoyladenylate synthase [Patescibacteria group bacterium]
MQTIKINKYRLTKRALTRAVEVLRAGGVVVHPSESSYGLAVDPTIHWAVKKIFRLKGRPSGKPLLLAAESVQQAETIVRLNTTLRNYAQKHWPGPLTIVAPAKKKIDLTGTSRPTTKIAIRVPAAVWLRALARELGHPVTSTSVNLTGEPPAFTSAGVRSVFADQGIKPDLFLDAGALPHRPPSTIIDQAGTKIRILRQGSVKL